jgi:hypothetical protein
MFSVGDIDGPVVVIGATLDVVVAVVVDVEGLLLAVVPHAVNAGAAMIATATPAAATRPAFNPDLISLRPIVRESGRDDIAAAVRTTPIDRNTVHSPLGGDMTIGPRVMFCAGADVVDVAVDAAELDAVGGAAELGAELGATELGVYVGV